MLDLCLPSKQNSAVWFVILCWHIRHTHLPSSMQRGRTSYPHVAADLMGFTALLLSQQSVPLVCSPLGECICFVMTLSMKTVSCCVFELYLYVHSTSSGLLCSDLSSSLPPGCRRYSVALMKLWIQATWLSAQVMVSSSSHLFDTFIKVCNKMCPRQVLVVLFEICVCVCASRSVCLTTCYLLVVLVCFHKLL